MKKIILLLSLLIFTSAYAVMIDSDKAACQMTWNTPGDTMQMICCWKANSEADINNQLGQMNDFFEPHKFIECTDQVMDYNAK